MTPLLGLDLLFQWIDEIPLSFPIGMTIDISNTYGKLLTYDLSILATSLYQLLILDVQSIFLFRTDENWMAMFWPTGYLAMDIFQTLNSLLRIIRTLYFTDVPVNIVSKIALLSPRLSHSGQFVIPGLQNAIIWFNSTGKSQTEFYFSHQFPHICSCWLGTRISASFQAVGNILAETIVHLQN